MYNTYRGVIKGEYVDPADMISIDSSGVESIQKLRSEVCSIPEKPGSNNGLIQIMSKADMKKLGLSSPNMADAIMMSMFTPRLIERKPRTHKRRKVV